MAKSSATKLQNLLQAKKAEILAIADRHGAYNLRVFGSVARAEDTPTSDIDLLVDYDPAKRSPWFPIGFIQELETLLQHRVDVAPPAMLKERCRDRILQEAIPL
jgi:predicted nucleotidyltransferase